MDNGEWEKRCKQKTAGLRLKCVCVCVFLGACCSYRDRYPAENLLHSTPYWSITYLSCTKNTVSLRLHTKSNFLSHTSYTLFLHTPAHRSTVSLWQNAWQSSTLIAIITNSLHWHTQTHLPEITAKIGYDIGVFTVLHHYNLLLDDSKVFTWREHTCAHNNACFNSWQGHYLQSNRKWGKRVCSWIWIGWFVTHKSQ